MTEMFGEAWSPMSVPDLAPDDDDDDTTCMFWWSWRKSHRNKTDFLKLKMYNALRGYAFIYEFPE